MEDINTGKLNFDNRANSIMENEVLTEFECYPLVREYNSGPSLTKKNAAQNK